MKPTTDPPKTTSQQLQARREAASRLEPLECGHRDPLDCTASCTGETRETEVSPEAPEFDPGDIAGLWADARSLWYARDFPPYASTAWRELHPDDPKRLAAALEAAEMWRKYGDDVTQWLKDAFAPHAPVWQRPTLAERDAAAHPQPPHQLRATPGWPPIQIPGKPGRYLTHRQELAA
ncbi:hypothetical protein [Streptomyces sp. NPDC020681]|uniref:hypothetical protein n=1 Tax=Streptomyces sp. NPDC020681 TaxID=3365083 RepID=UPI0037A9A725